MFISFPQLLTLSGLAADNFKSLKRRDQLPFGLSGDIEYRHGHYDLRAAVFMVAADQLAGNGGVDREVAARLLRTNPELVIENLNRAETEDVWISFFREDPLDFFMGEAGTFAEIANKIEQARAEAKESDVGPLYFSAAYSASLSFAVRMVRQRAAGFNIELPAPGNW